MEIKFNTNIDPIGRVAVGQTKKTEAKAEGEGAAFSKSEALNQTLRQLPDSRTAEVAKGKQLAGTSTYPPPEIIKKIASLLAMHGEA